MHSKWKIWDYFRANQAPIDPSVRVYAFNCFNPFIFKMIKSKIDYSLFENHELKVILGKELTEDWIREKLKTMDLFGGAESYLIQSAEDISENCWRILFAEDDLILDNRYLIFNFNKVDTSFKQLVKFDSDKLKIVSINAPAFWEENELIRFLADHFQVYLDYKAIEAIKAEVNFDFTAYFHLFNAIKQSYGDKLNVTNTDINELFSDFKLDQFGLAELFSTKRFKEFYQKFIPIVERQSNVIPFLYFMQSHLLKIYDPAAIESKSKHTKYDRQILAQANMWNKADLAKAIAYFSDLLIQVKSRDTFCEYKIKRDYLKYFSL